MNPACEIDEYASRRFTFAWASAAMLPQASEMHARTAIAILQSSSLAGNATVSRRSATASATALVAAAMKPVTGVGAPS